jgi:hypothetical protein
MDPRKGVRRATLAVLLLLLVTVPIVMGFVLAQDSHAMIAVDLRGTPTANDLDDWAIRIQNSKDSVITVIDTAQSAIKSCAATDKSSSCVIRSRTTTSLFADKKVSMPDVLRGQYGVDIPPGTAYWQGTVTTSTGFDGLAAIVSFVVIGVLGAVAYGALLRRTPAPQPVAPQPVAPYRQYHPPHQPQRQLAEATTGPPRHQQAVSATQSVPPARALTPELRSLVTKARGKAVARTHITADGGYVAVGGTVVWATLRPSDEAVVVPEDRLDVLAIDEESEALVVAPTSTERGPRP